VIKFPILTIGQSKANPGPLIDMDLLRSMYEAGFNLVLKAADAPSADAKRFWFGAGGLTNSGAIDTAAGKMRDYMNGGMTKMHYLCTATAGSMMSFNQYAFLKVPGGPPEDKLGKATNVQVNAGFSSPRFGFGEKVGAILHEITHMCIGTNDVVYEGREMYGADYCVELAEADTNLALTNADNWCYYFTSYHDQIVQKGKDWSGLTPAEVANRRAGR